LVKKHASPHAMDTGSCHSNGKENQEVERPNILIAMGDDISFPHMSAYGCKLLKHPVSTGLPEMVYYSIISILQMQNLLPPGHVS